ncbi:MAG: hypothetical protein IPL26_01235 [Leptospiraceae bacterium]|nr:hypothetical protein [Leptospiraceae bacterium]
MNELQKNRKSEIVWTNMRQEIEKLRKEMNISLDDFKPIGINQWQEIQKTIEKNFVKLTHYTNKFHWYWACFSQDSYSIQCKIHPHKYLDKVFEKENDLLFFVSDQVHETPKFWFYKGKLPAIQKIIEESYCIGEYYFASERMDWLLCVNHHHYLIGTGDDMVERIKQLEKEILLK